MRVGLLGHLLSFTPGYRRAGVSRYIEALVRSLPDADPSLELVVFTNKAASRCAREQIVTRVTWAVSRLPTQRPPVRILWEQCLARAATRRWRLDLLHAPVNVVPLAGPRPLVLTVHDLAFLRYPEHYPPLKQRYLAALTRRSTRRADLVIAVSGQTRADVVELCGVRPEKVVVVPNGVDASLRPVRDAGVLQAFRQAHGLPNEFFLFLGTLQPRKNLEGLLRAYDRARADLSLPLVVAGARGWRESKIFQLVRELDLADRVRFTGYINPDELPIWYSAATVFVYPSLYEGFGLPVLEAMACGTPVITSATSSLPEVAGDAAILVDPHDTDALARALRELASSPRLRAELTSAGLERARAFSWERTARETLEVYRRAMERAPARPAVVERRG
ncbi:D-inositol 3-phosphate glycosyltransferase [bacterium HR26]|nr:D-inositol 3-phosphate glycosyltransferase [bacterium HR26]